MIVIALNYNQQNVQHTEGLLGEMWVTHTVAIIQPYNILLRY